MGRTTQWLMALLLLASFTACIEHQLVPCGDQLCPRGTTCIGDRLCARADQIDACVGVTDGDTCSVSGGAGLCDLGVCIGSGCGNGVQELPEVCDDGNATSGDGCRADCRKVEECGDAIHDDGELCDDGNDNAADGCDACVATTWRATATLGGKPNATEVGLSYPAGIAVDWYGNVYVADAEGHRIRRLDVATGVMTTVAGTGNPGAAGVGGVATSAELNTPSSVAVDGLGMIYIADANNHRILRVDATGIITTLAGTGTPGYSGDNGPASSAELGRPSGVAVDGLGNVYIADTDNQRIRRVDTTGVIATVAGTGIAGFFGDGGVALAAQLNYPHGIALDDVGNVFIADTGNGRIRKFTSTGMISTVASGLSSAYGVAVDDIGRVYVADEFYIRRVDTSGVVTTVAGRGYGTGPIGDGGPATDGLISFSDGVAVDRVGNFYLSESGGHRIRRVDAGGIITTVAGTGISGGSGDGVSATTVPLQDPFGVALDGLGNVYVVEMYNHRVRRIDAAGVVATVAGTGIQGDSGDGGPATSAQLAYPRGLALDGSGNLYVADSDYGRIRRIDVNGIITTVAGNGSLGFSGDGGPATSAQLFAPTGVAVDNLGNLYVADTLNNRVRKIDSAGIITTVAGNGIQGFSGDGSVATAARLDSPHSVAVAGGVLYISDQDNHRIRKVSAGEITTIAGTGAPGFSGEGSAAVSAQLNKPAGLRVDGLGNLYIVDYANHRIRRIGVDGNITTIVGTGSGGFDGDGGDATSAQVRFPEDIALGLGGTIYFTELGVTAFGYVRRISPTGVLTTIAGLVDPDGMGPVARARLGDPRALVLSAPFTLVAGGATGTVQAVRTAPAVVEVVAGRYPQATVIGARARFRGELFGDVSGVAYDAAAGVIYLTESNRVHVVTIVDVADEGTWTIAPLANVSGQAGFADGAVATARFRAPTGLYFDEAARQLYVADSGNHAVRAIDLSGGVSSATVRTVAGSPATRGFFGDGGAATAALLYAPQAITRCQNGDLFIADTGNHRVRRVAAGVNTISTVLGDGVGASSGEGRPATAFPVHAPLGLACDSIGNLYATSTTTVRMVPADPTGTVDGAGRVQTIYGAPPRATFPASVTTCLTGLAIVDATSLQVVDSCTGLLVELRREHL